MAARLLAQEVSDLCLGKPALRQLPSSATVSDALSLLRRRVSSSGDPSLTVWSAAGDPPSRCVGEVSIVDILCFLCRGDNLSLPSDSLLHSPLSLLLSPPSHEKPRRPVKLLEPNASLHEAIDCILEGAHGLIVPRRSRGLGSPRHKPLQKQRQFCWITQEDVVRFLFNSINLFPGMASQSIESLNIINSEILAVHYDDPALSALSALTDPESGGTAVAVIDEEGRLVGELSPHTLAHCDETVAPAVATLSAGDLMAYIDYGGPSEDLTQLVKSRLEENNLHAMLNLLLDDHLSSSSGSSSLGSSSSSSSSDDEVRSLRHRSNSGQFSSGTEPIVCHPQSSLIAVIIKALSHRLNHVWVVEEDYSVVGMVTFTSILKVFRDYLHSYS